MVTDQSLIDKIPARNRGRKRSAFLCLFNLPWIIAWFVLSRPGAERDLAIPALYCLLVILTVGLVILPPLLLQRFRKRWLLTIPLAIVNIFWALRWISAFSTNPPHTPNYSQLRIVYIALMALCSLVVITVYRISDNAGARPTA